MLSVNKTRQRHTKKKNDNVVTDTKTNKKIIRIKDIRR